MLIVQQLKNHSFSFRRSNFARRNLKWLDALPGLRWLVGQQTLSFMKSRTLFFPVFELVFGTLVVISLYRYGVTGNFLKTAIFILLGTMLAMVSANDDWRDSITPKVITHPGIIIGLIVAIFTIPVDLALPNRIVQIVGALTSSSPWLTNSLLSLINSILGVILAGGSLWLTGQIWERLRGTAGVGLGAVKTGMMIGAFGGWRLSIVAIFVAVQVGSIVGVLVMVRQQRRDVPILLPFTAFLVLGGIIALLWGHPIVHWYLQNLKK